MIFNVITGTKRKAAVTVYGAPSETVTITDGTDTYTVTTDAHGIGTTTPEVKYGTFTVTGTKSATVSGFASGRSVTVGKNTSAISAYPPGALFWLGNGDTSGDSLWGRCGGWHFAKGAYPYGYGDGGAGTNQGAALNAGGDGWTTYANHDGSTTLVGIASETGVSLDFTGFTKLKVFCDSYEQNSGESGIWMCASNFSTAGAKTALAYLSLGNATKETKTLALSGSTGYFCASATNARKYKEYGVEVWTECSSSNTIYAAWLE